MRYIPGFKGFYSVNEYGQVFSTKRKHPIELKPVPNSRGYLCVSLRKDGKQYTSRVHRLVAMVFLPNPENKPHINHKDGIKINNQVDNLEWCTRSENCKHAYDTLKRDKIEGSKHPKSKLIVDMETGIFYDSIKFASEAKNISRNHLKHHLRFYGHYRGLVFA